MIKIINNELYIKAYKKNKKIIFISQISIIILFFLIWELLAHYNLINTFIYSSPTNIFNTLINLYKQNNLFIHIYTTLYETIIAFTLGTIISFLVALLLYQYKTLSKILDPFIIMLNSLPKIALGPLIIIIAGANTKSIIVMALLINLITSLTSIYTGFINTDKTKIKLLHTFNASKIQILKYVVIPSAFKTIISTLKLTISMSLIGVIMGEFLVSKRGIGYLIIYGTQVFNLSLVYTGVILLAIISFILYKLVTYIEKKLIISN